MDKKNFEVFLRQLSKDKNNTVEINWENEKKEFIQYTEKLYDIFEGTLKSYSDIQIKKKKININEENVGSYSIDEMIIEIGDKKIMLIPIGTGLIGAKGRVDMKGQKGFAKIVLVSDDLHSLSEQIKVTTTVGSTKAKPSPTPKKSIGWEWRFLGPRAGIYAPVTKSQILSAIVELTNG
jgi:hypothetical protein